MAGESEEEEEPEEEEPEEAEWEEELAGAETRWDRGERHKEAGLSNVQRGFSRKESLEKMEEVAWETAWAASEGDGNSGRASSVRQK